MTNYLELADQKLKEIREKSRLIDGHPVAEVLWETEKMVIFRDPEGNLWRRVHAWNRTWLMQIAQEGAIREEAPEPITPQGQPSIHEEHSESYLYPKDGNWRFTKVVPQSSVEKVDRIRDLALSLGWSKDRLYQNRGNLHPPYGDELGLVCLVYGDRRIGEVTEKYIEIICPGPDATSLRFYNPDAEQPWLKHADHGKGN